MLRQIIKIDEEKCSGCGLCASACHEGAIKIIDGKARLVREDFCDGLGDCLPGCPMGAISFEEREAPFYDEKAVQASKAQSGQDTQGQRSQISEDKISRHLEGGGCPGSLAKVLIKPEDNQAQSSQDAQQPGQNGSLDAQQATQNGPQAAPAPQSRLAQWPCQIKLAPAQAPFFSGAKLLLAADCTAYAYANMHEDFMKGRVTLIGCPKLDAVDYSIKLTEILKNNDIKSLTLVRMEVPCCGGLQFAAEKALKASGKVIPWQVVTISTDGRILED